MGELWNYGWTLDLWENFWIMGEYLFGRSVGQDLSRGVTWRYICTHIGEKLFDCKECGARISWNKCHMQKHTGGKPFICKEFGAEFVRSGNVKQHTSIHTGEKPFSCKECGAGFSQGSHLKTHTVKKTFYLKGVWWSISPKWSSEETYANTYWSRNFPNW